MAKGLDTENITSEKHLLSQVRDLARICGWMTYHHPYSLGADPGFPDLVLVRDRVIFAELKGPRGRLSPQQEKWLDALKDAGAEVYIWYPEDLEKAAKVLSPRTRST